MLVPIMTEGFDFLMKCIGGGGTQLFSGRGVWPGFPKWGACELILASEKGACELKISKFGACELKISQFEGLWAKNFQILGLES